MQRTRKPCVMAVRAASLCVVAGLAGSAVADVIKIKNTSDGTVKLSDLIVWNAAGQQEVIKKAGFDAAGSADDEDIPSGATRSFVSTITNVNKWYVSCKGQGTEPEWSDSIQVTVIGPRRCSGSAIA